MAQLQPSLVSCMQFSMNNCGHLFKVNPQENALVMVPVGKVQIIERATPTLKCTVGVLYIVLRKNGIDKLSS